MPFEQTGYQTRPFTDIVEDVRLELETKLGTPITSESDTVIGVLNNIFCNQLSIQENNVQALSNNLDVYKAEGVYLDKLVAYIGLARLDESPATGELKITRSSVTDINNSVTFSNTSGIEFICPTVQTRLESCSRVKLKPVTVVDGVLYDFTINGANLSITSQLSDTASTIVDFFVEEVTSLLGFSATKEDNCLVITLPDSDLNSLNISSVTGLTTQEVTAFNPCESVDKRFLQVALNTITTTVTSNATILSSNNPVGFVNGRDLETDEELRARYELSFARAGNTTFDNILAELLQLPNVTDAFIIENKAITADAITGLPAKSYSCVVVDGSEANIARTIWETKPVGVETHGSVASVVQDIKGNNQTVYWERPEEVFIFVEVSYSLYDEEVFPSNGEALIKQAVLDYGQSLTLNNDVIPERFIGGIYRGVDGVDSISIRIGKSSDVNATSPTGGYQTGRIPIDILEVSVFTSAKLDVIAL